MKDDSFVGFCDVCGREVYDDEIYYRMPDGCLVCEDWICVTEWLEQYEHRG